MKTTLNKIREHEPCAEGWEKLLTYLGKTKADDEPLSLLTILDSNGLNDAIWCLRAVEGHDKEIRLFAVWCARQVQHLMTDKRSLDAIDVAERYANGEATDAELKDAWNAAWSAHDASWSTDAWATRSAAMPAAMSAAWAAEAARDATMAAAGTVAWDSARDSAMAAWVARSAAEDAARDEMRLRQEAELRRICGEVEG